MRREIHEGLQVVENWNSANTEVFYGKDSELTGSDREDVIYPVVGGVQGLTDLVNEHTARSRAYEREKRKVFRSSCRRSPR